MACRAELLRMQKGQVLVQVAMLMVVFFAFLAIAIDMGHIFNERRHMQNAADAGALAGAWELCFGDPAQAEQTAREYAIDRNGAQVADVSIGELTVTVYAREDAGLYFARVLGIETADVNAKAVAACGAATSGCNIWPVAFPIGGWQELWDDEGGCDNNDFYVHAGHKDDGPDCNEYDCDVDDDGDNDIVGFQGRAFLDFGHDPDPLYPDDCRKSGCGDDELKCWFQGPGGHVDIGEGVCIAGTTGVKAGVKKEVDAREGDIVGIPIYSDTDCPNPLNCNGERYWVTQISCVRLLEWVHSLELQPTNGGKKWQNKAIHAQMVCDDCDSECGSTTGEVPGNWEMSAVSLIE